MTTPAQSLPRPASCPACVVPQPEMPVADDVAPGQIILSLPTAHCAACISTVERRLNAHPGVRAARVNLSLKRVAVDARPGVTADELIAALAEVGYPAHELDPALLAEAGGDRTGRDLLMRLAVAGFAMMNVMLLSISVWAGAEGIIRDMLHWFSALIALPAIVFSGQPFYRNAWQALKARKLNMDVPISLAILLAAGMSLYETSQGGRHAYFDAALSLTFFLLAGRYLDYRTRWAARSAAQELSALEVPRALKLVEGREEPVPVGDLVPGDVILIRPGMRIPVDGRVLTGRSELNRAFLTGESLPVAAGPDSPVHAGEVNLTGPLSVQVTARAADSGLRRIAELVALAESARNRYTSLADRAAAAYAPGVHLLAALALAGWMLATGDFRLSLGIAISVLIITCPCALGLAVPAVTTAASGRLYRKGVLLKSGTALERLAEVDLALFDKTGTLTTGEPELDADSGQDAERLALAAALGRASSHPLAQALVAAARARGLELPEVENIRERPGYGVEGRWQGRPVRLGRPAWLGAAAPEASATALQVGDAPATVFTFTDRLRPGVKEAIDGLIRQGVAVRLVTGDTPAAAWRIAAQLGIDEVAAGVTPEDKLRLVQELAREGRKVLMVGDGLNDTGALAAAHVAISPASAIDAARVAADVVVLGQDFAVVAECLATARKARRLIKQNFALATAYNVIAVPIALAGLATPLLAALAMSASSITVTLNSWRVR